MKLTSRYAMERGADRGLVTLIRTVIRVRREVTMPDWIDLVFTPETVFLIHTTASNAGIFTGSEVYRLRYDQTGAPETATIRDRNGGDLLMMLEFGLAAYRGPAASRAGCT